MEALNGKVDVTKAIVWGVAFVGVCVLVYAGKVDSNKIEYFLVWLLPSPLRDEKKEAPKPTGDGKE